MKFMKSLGCCSVFTVLSLLSAPAMAASLSFTPTNSAILADDVFAVDIVLSDMRDSDTLSAFDFDISFDSSVLSFDSYSLGVGLGVVDGISAWDASSGNYAPGLVNLAEFSLIGLDSSTGDSFFADQFTSPSNSMTLATLSFQAINPGMSVLSFANVTLADEAGNPFSAVTVDPVPEPATMLLFGTGLAGLLGGRLRKKKA
ncbi:MAG: hypothetical protein BM485_10300 [Desulfobulbaceae bacterium DB1]|nr:MAG: hypothetical protein BM485_10300 [Desulfobulbaceae bacterium DB1]